MGDKGRVIFGETCVLWVTTDVRFVYVIGKVKILLWNVREGEKILTFKI